MPQNVLKYHEFGYNTHNTVSVEFYTSFMLSCICCIEMNIMWLKEEKIHKAKTVLLSNYATMTDLSVNILVR